MLYSGQIPLLASRVCVRWRGRHVRIRGQQSIRSNSWKIVRSFEPTITELAVHIVPSNAEELEDLALRKWRLHLLI